MKKFLVVFSFLIFSFLGSFSQDNSQQNAQQILNNRGEVYFSFNIDSQLINQEKIEQLSRIISIDQVEDNTVKAYANKKEFAEFLQLGINYKILPAPSMLIKPKMLDTREASGRETWDYYPTYPAYVSIMNQFATDYPDLCEVINITTLASGREILCMHINNNLGTDEGEPEFLYTSSIHGDEITGYVLMLHLIDYLLENYGTNDEITNLVDNVDIWINPLANPDGTYAGGNNTVYGATRYNANWVDLNRNYPDPEDGPHPDNEVYQPETQAFMDFADEHDFVMSANFHGGAEVLNYPWDTWSRLAADDDWWKYVCRQYADTAQANSPNGYLTYLNNGISNGYQWYSISGGRQDYMNYFKRCREVTAEISSIKTIPANQLEPHWEYNYRSLIHYMEQTLYGVRGIVTNVQNGSPVPAKVTILGHDLDNSEVYANLPVGDYHRLLKAGTYNLTFSALGYFTKTINDVIVTDENTTLLDVQLQPSTSLTSDFTADDTLVGLFEPVNFTDLSLGENIVSWQWEFEGGTPETSSEQNPQGIIFNETGKFNVSLTITTGSGGQNTLQKEDYIKAYPSFTMVNDSTVYTCGAIFYDDGGKDDNYGNNIDYTMTFISELESGYLKVIFETFDVENSSGCNSDYLEIYDGTDVNSALLGKFCGNELPAPIESSNIDGALTFHFVSNSNNTFPGWKALVSCDTNVGMPKTEEIFVKVFPNPAQNYIQVVSPRKINLIKLRSINGNLLQIFKINAEKTELDIHSFPSGLYLLEIATGEMTSYKKIIIK